MFFESADGKNCIGLTTILYLKLIIISLFQFSEGIVPDIVTVDLVGKK